MGLLTGMDVIAAGELTEDQTAPVMTEAEFEAFHRSTVRGLRAYATRVIGNAAHADDVVQEAYLRFLRSRTPGASTDHRRAFLFRVATNLIVDHWRSRRFETGAAVNDEPARLDPDVPLRIDMQRAFAQLRPDERAMMWLAYVEGADHREIARAVGVGRASVRVLLFRTRRKLARLLRDTGAPGGE